MFDIQSFSKAVKAQVFLNFGIQKFCIGNLLYSNREVLFEFETDFLNKNLSISPVYLKNQVGVQSFLQPDLYNLPGVFYDALPDGWGILLQDRFLSKLGLNAKELNPIQRLLLREQNAIGALEFVPEYDLVESHPTQSIESLYLESIGVLKGESSEIIPYLLQLNGSSTGARPKVMVRYLKNSDEWLLGAKTDTEYGEDWIIKFPNQSDGHEAGVIEFIYSKLAKLAGLEFPESRLIESPSHRGYFAVKRFDRDENKRLHIHSLSGLLHHNFRIPSLDYENIFQAVFQVTQSVQEIEKLFLQMVFNICFHNRDDHGKNFSFLMDERGKWKLSPAYDLTYSFGPNGEHSTTVLGEGKKPSKKDVLKLASLFEIDKTRALEMIEKVTETSLKWLEFAKMHNISKLTTAEIEKRILRF